jgi:hypothetical protein
VESVRLTGSKFIRANNDAFNKPLSSTVGEAQSAGTKSKVIRRRIILLGRNKHEKKNQNLVGKRRQLLIVIEESTRSARKRIVSQIDPSYPIVSIFKPLAIDEKICKISTIPRFTMYDSH